MIKPIGTNPAQQNNNKYNIHKKLVPIQVTPQQVLEQFAGLPA